eukprot:1139594-Prorocentrum_minimum.AAC.1
MAHIVRERQSNDILRAVSDRPPLAPRPPTTNPKGGLSLLNCGSANSARHTAMNESSSREWRTVRHDAIAR